MEDSPADVGLRFGARPYCHGLQDGFAALANDAIWIRHDKPRFVGRIRVEIQNAARKHVGRDDVEHTLGLIDPLTLQPQEWQPLARPIPASPTVSPTV